MNDPCFRLDCTCLFCLELNLLFGHVIGNFSFFLLSTFIYFSWKSDFLLMTFLVSNFSNYVVVRLVVVVRPVVVVAFVAEWPHSAIVVSQYRSPFI